MGQLVLLVVAAAWAAVLIPPLLRSRLENRPNSSVTDFRNQLSSLQRAMPSRGGMRSMSRPLAPSPLTRPAAAGRPVLRSGVRTHGPARQPNRQPSRPGRGEAQRMHDASLRTRSPADRHRARSHRAVGAEARPPVSARDAIKRRRANVLFVLVLVAACALFLAATTKAEAMLYTFVLAFMALCGYVYLLGQVRQRERLQPPRPVLRPVPPPGQEPQRQSQRPPQRQPQRWTPATHAV
jgi:hypothetical protein